MTVNLSIKNVPEALAERLRERAKRHNRSLQGELMTILQEAVEPRQLSIEEARERVASLSFRTADEATRWIREDRDAG